MLKRNGLVCWEVSHGRWWWLWEVGGRWVGGGRWEDGREVGGKKKFPNYSEMENFWRPLDGQCCQENNPPGIFLHIMFTPGTIMTMKQWKYLAGLH